MYRTAPGPAASRLPEPPGRGRRALRTAWRLLRWPLAAAAALTAASLLYNAATSGYAGRPAGLTFVRTGNVQTRYRAWGTTGRPVVLVPGAFETADTFAALGARLGTDHRVFALDLTGTGYSQAWPPFTVTPDAAQVLAFIRAMGLTGRNAPVVVGHSSGAAVAGLAALDGGRRIAGVMFLDGDARPLAIPSFAPYLIIDPYRTTLFRLGHLTMISAPHQVAAAIRALCRRAGVDQATSRSS